MGSNELEDSLGQFLQTVPATVKIQKGDGWIEIDTDQMRVNFGFTGLLIQRHQTSTPRDCEAQELAVVMSSRGRTPNSRWL